MLRTLTTILLVFVAAVAMSATGTHPWPYDDSLASASSAPVIYGDSGTDVTFLFPSDFHSTGGSVVGSAELRTSVMFDGIEPDLLYYLGWNWPVTDLFEHTYTRVFEQTYAAGSTTRYHTLAERNVNLTRKNSTFNFTGVTGGGGIIDAYHHFIFLDASDDVTGVAWLSAWNAGTGSVVYWANHDKDNPPTNSASMIVDPIWGTNTETSTLLTTEGYNVYDATCAAKTPSDLIGQTHIVAQNVGAHTVTLRYYAGLDTTDLGENDCIAEIGAEATRNLQLNAGPPTIAIFATGASHVSDSSTAGRYFQSAIDSAMGEGVFYWKMDDKDPTPILKLWAHPNFGGKTFAAIWSDDAAYNDAPGDATEVVRFVVGSQSNATYNDQSSIFWGPVWLGHPDEDDYGVSFIVPNNLTGAHDWEIADTAGKLVPLGGGNANYGVPMWGVSDAGGAAIYDTGTEICALRDLACVDVYNLATPGDSDCTGPEAAGNNFIAMCE